jgi:hypothetical protein
MTVCSSIHSQNTSTITITSDQLRTANLIFAEHKEYSKLIPLLQLENSNLMEINKSWERTDSIKSIQLYQKNKMIAEQSIDMNRLKTTSNTCGTIAGISILVTVLCLLLK